MTKRNPYHDAPPYRRWRSAMGDATARAGDLVVSFPMRIAPEDKIVTAGSCFAQHIARHLKSGGFHFLETESAHPILSESTAAAFQYGVYSARYGNIYTSRQLLQLLRRAYSQFIPEEDIWLEGDRFIDPFRPTIQPGGFTSSEEYWADRRQHLAAVRSALEAMDVFVFTLGLTELWASRADGAAYPVCPGIAGGVFDPNLHVLINLSVDEVVSDMTAFVDELRTINAKARIVLTVSPVALAATAEDRHVVVSTAYSKAVLRVAAQMLTRLPDVHYFPSYEIIAGPGAAISFLAEDRRTVTEAGVARVMEQFFDYVTTESLIRPADSDTTTTDLFLENSRAAVDLLCDETMLDQP